MPDKRNDPVSPTDELFVVELEDRLEFGAAIVDSDLAADDNTGCSNVSSCGTSSNTNCTNGGCH